MKITNFMHWLCINRKIKQTDIARMTNRSRSFIHGIMYGYKSLDENGIQEFITKLGLTEAQALEFRQAIYEAKPKLSFDIKDMTEEQAKVLASLKAKLETDPKNTWPALAKAIK